MLQLQVTLSETYNEDTQSFESEIWNLELEHSLVSLSKWESKYEKPFLSNDEKGGEEVLDYIVMMDLGTNTPDEVFASLTDEHVKEINAYINAKMTATWFTKTTKPKVNRQTVTSELIYYWITSYKIPWVVETWHLNRLFTLIEVFNAEHSAQQGKKSSTNKVGLAEQRRALNEQRKRELGTSG